MFTKTAILLAIAAATYAYEFQRDGPFIYLPARPGAISGIATLPERIDICNLPMDAGFGRAHILAYYFDSEQGACLPFFFGGGQGNANRFRHLHDCEVRCMRN